MAIQPAAERADMSGLGGCLRELTSALRMTEFAHLVSLAFLPSLVAGAVLAVVWRYVDVGPFRTALQTIAALLFFIPQPFALFLGSYSAGLRPYQQALLSMWGLGVGALMFAQLKSRTAFGVGAPSRLTRAAGWRQTPDEITRSERAIAAIRRRRPSQPNKVVLGAGATAMTALGFWCGWTTVGDYFLAHEVVAGRLEGARVIRNLRSPNTYQVLINARPYNITFDLLSLMDRGDYIEADVGAATNTIVAIRRQRHSESTVLTR
jgi:hypothetical protein